ncbi:MAG: hypothetical protein ABI746_08335 [Dermatophilaceae bacterium]
MAGTNHPHRPRLGEDDPTGMHEMLSGLPAPHVMPPELVERIQKSLRNEVRQSGHVDDSAGRPDTYALFAGRARRPVRRDVIVGGAGVAGFALIAALAATMPSLPGVTAQITSRTVTPEHLLVQPHSSLAEPVALGSAHIRSGTTAYTADRLRDQARALRAAPTTPLREGAAQQTDLGPIATPVGLSSCLQSLGLPADAAAWVDLARYEDHPVAVIVTHEGDTDRVRVVTRSCHLDDPGLLAGPYDL